MSPNFMYLYTSLPHEVGKPFLTYRLVYQLRSLAYRHDPFQMLPNQYFENLAFNESHQTYNRVKIRIN